MSSFIQGDKKNSKYDYEKSYNVTGLMGASFDMSDFISLRPLVGVSYNQVNRYTSVYSSPIEGCEKTESICYQNTEQSMSIDTRLQGVFHAPINGWYDGKYFDVMELVCHGTGVSWNWCVMELVLTPGLFAGYNIDTKKMGGGIYYQMGLRF